ncbi:MAG: FtsQ-type POTRA domain-containing protein [Caldilineae bacterium]|nr:MAG: FtsQ-type POTRA domain-containing protein [Caldilineae bacterium]
MSRYYHRTPHRNIQPRTRRKGRNRRKRRFASPSLAVLNPRTLFSAKGRKQRQPRPKRARTLRHLLSQKAWNSSHLGALVLLLAALAALTYSFISIDFWVYGAVVSGNRYTPTDLIYQQAGIHGYSVYFVEPALVADRLTQLEHVRAARVQVRLPARVRIEVVEREPIILYKVRGDSYWIDDEGVISTAVEPREGLITLVDDDTGARLDERHLDPAILQAIVYVTRQLPEVRIFRYQQPYGLFFIAPEGWRVYFGTADNMSTKLERWETMRAHILSEGGRAQEVDLRYDPPYWR